MNKITPSGTVTFLFTDIEGSTQLWVDCPHAMPSALQRHNDLLRQAIESCYGYVFQIVGDAFCAAFASACDAVQAAICAQRELNRADWAETGSIKVRMAIHTGIADVHAGEYTSGEYISGLTLSRVSRLLSAGHGGQTLISRATRDLLVYDMPEGVSFRDLGEHRLKGLSQPEQIYQLIHPDLPAEFPPLNTLGVRPNNLPLQLTSFIGRKLEIEKTKQQLSASRLVTLTGSGGVGKTRLAIEVGQELLPFYLHGVWLVELAPLADPELAPQVLITLFALPADPRRSASMVLADYLREKTALLILDNCEHIIEACARLAEYLLTHCPQIRILASSREALGIEGEITLRVPSLSLPPAGRSRSETIDQSEAVQLFLDRAAVALPEYTLTEANTGAIVEVCRRLDGIPLAIELAASRVKILKVEQIAGRLDDAFRLLTGGSRTALPRQQTLRATIDWSYNLLSDAERRVLRRLAVFAGGGGLEAIEAICSGDGVQDYEVLDGLTHLVDKSLVNAERMQGVEPRYSLLETIRQYAREKLNESGEGQAVRARHANWYAKLAETIEPKTHAHGQIGWLDRLEQELDNFRAALEWSLDNDVELGLRIASALTWFWVLRSHYIEGYQRMGKLLAAWSPTPSLLQSRALTWAAWLAVFTHDDEQCIAYAKDSIAMSGEVGYMEGQSFSLITLAYQHFQHGDYEQALPLAEAGLALFRKTKSLWGIRHALGVTGVLTQVTGNLELANVLFQESLRLSREIGDLDGASWALYLLGNQATMLGNYEKAIAYYQESLPIAQEVRNRSVISWIMANMGTTAMLLGDYSQAKALLEESTGMERELGDYPYLADALTRSGRLARLQEEYDDAWDYYSESLRMAWKYDAHDTVSSSITGLAELNALWGQPRKAARLLAAAQAIPVMYFFTWPDMRFELERIVDAIRSQLDETTFEAEQAAGRQMALADVVESALQDPRG